MKKLSFLIILLYCQLANTTSLYPFSDEQLSIDFEELTKSLRCVVCQNQSLNESMAPIAIDLKNEIYEQLHTGKSKEDINQYMVERYGDFILLKPTFKSEMLLLWGSPLILLILGTTLLRRLFKHAKPTNPERQHT